MLDKLVLAALGRTTALRSIVKEELARLQEGGYLSGEEFEQLSTQCLSTLETQIGKAQKVASPLVSGLGKSVRHAFDLPSASEIRALTEALQRSRTEGTSDGESAQG